MAKYTRQDIVDLIDDEDIEFMQHEFISYRQAMDYYNLGYKPIVRLSHKAGDSFNNGGFSY